MPKAKRKTRKKHEQNIVVTNHGIRCPHCGNCHGHKVTNTYPNGRRRRLCGECGRPFVDREETRAPISEWGKAAQVNLANAIS